MSLIADVHAIGDSDAPLIRAQFPSVQLFTQPEGAIAELVDGIMQNAAHVGLLAVADAIAIVAPHDQGGIANSFRTDPASSVGGLELTGASFLDEGIVGRVFSSLPQAVVLEDGRQPGTYVNAEGIAALTAWAGRKLGVSGKDATSAAFAIATLIHKRGLPGRHYLAQAAPLAQAQVALIFENAGEAIAAALSGAA